MDISHIHHPAHIKERKRQLDARLRSKKRLRLLELKLMELAQHMEDTER